MYYRNASAAVITYDITNQVRPAIRSGPAGLGHDGARGTEVIPRGAGVGEGAARAQRSQPGDCAGRQQARPSRRAAGDIRGAHRAPAHLSWSVSLLTARPQAAHAFAAANGMLHYETSAKTGHNVAELFSAIGAR